MPNDPRVKFKKRIYDPSRNLMYEERTGGGGGNPPGGGGYVPPSVIPDNPYKPPPPHDDPSVPTDFPTYFKPTIVPFDPYQRRITERGNTIRDKMVADENARLKVKPKPIVKPQVIDRPRPKSGVLDDLLEVDEDSGTIPKDITGPFQPMKNQFGLKFKITPLDQPSKITRTIDANPTGIPLQDLGDDLEKTLKAQNKLTSDLDTLSGETIAKRVSQMQTDGQSQEYIDAVVKIIRGRQLTKARKAALLTPEEHIELLEITLKNPYSSAAEIAKVKSHITTLKTEIKSNLDLAKPKRQTIKTQEDSLDIQKTKLKDKLAKIDNEISIASNQDQVAILEKQKVEIQKNLKALEDFGAQPAKPTTKPTASAPAKSFEAIKATLETKIMNINDQISKSNNLRRNAQFVRQRKIYEQQLAVVETNLKTVQKTQQVIDNAKQYAKNVELIKAGKTPPPPPKPAPVAEAPVADVAPARSARSIRLEQRLARIRDVATPDYLNLPPAPAPAQAQLEEGEMNEMGSLAPKNHIAEFENLVDTLVETAKESGFKVPEAPESIIAEGELAVKKYVYEQALEFAEAKNIFLSEYVVERGVLKPTGKAKSKTDQLKVLDEFYQRAVSQSSGQPARPSQASSSSSVRRPAGTPPASAPASPPEFAPHEEWLDINRGTQAPTAPKPADVMARLNEQFGSTSGSAQGTGSARADSILDTLDAIDSKLPPAGTRPPKGSTGGGTPAYSPNPSQRTSQRRQGETQPMEMDTVPLIDSATSSARPSARGKAKITKAPPSSTPAPKPKFNFGRTDMNIQGRLNINVASEFTNSVAGKFGSSLRGLSSRVPTLKAPSVNTIKRVGAEGGKMGAGIVVGIGVSYLMAQYFKEHPATDRFSQIGQQYAIGFSGAAAGNIVMRALAIAGRMGAKKVLSATGMKILVVESAMATRDAAVFVAAQLAVEIGVEALMDRYKFNHTTSKTTAAVAGSGVAIGMGAYEGGPYGAVIMAAFSAWSVTEAWFEGQEEDRMEEENKRTTAENANKVNSARMQLVKNLQLTNNDYDKAFDMLSNKQRENINLAGEASALQFRNSLSVEFNPLEKERNGNPYLPKDPEPDQIEQGFWKSVEFLAWTGSPAAMLLDWNEKSFQENEKREQEAKDKYYQAYVQWYINKKKEVISSPPPAEDEGFRLLERDTLGSWRTSAEFSGELAYQQTENYNRIVNNARQQVLNEWRGNMTTLDEIRARDQAGRDLVETAGLDESFYNDYETWVIQDATSQLAVQFNHFGINYRDADAKLVAVAGRDPSVLPALDKYYEVMTQLSKETNLPIAELARLDALPQDQQERELGKVNAIREQVIRAGLLSDKALVDEFNANLIRDMQSYGDNFEEIMRNINDQQMLMGYSYLYGITRTDFYNQLHLEAPVVVIPPNPYAGSTEFDYNKNRTPYDTLIYGYRYNLTDEQNQELEDYLYTRNRELYQNEGRQVTMDEVLERANFIYDRDRPIYRKSDEEVAKEQNMTLEEYYAEYGYDMDKKPPVEPILWEDITEREIPPTSIFAGQDESDEGAGERQANADLQASRIAGGGSADEFDRMAAGAYAAQQRALVDAQGGNNIAGDQPQPRTNENGETLRQENDPDGP